MRGHSRRGRLAGRGEGNASTRAAAGAFTADGPLQPPPTLGDCDASDNAETGRAMVCGLVVVVRSRKDAGARCIRDAEGAAPWREGAALWFRAVWVEESTDRRTAGARRVRGAEGAALDRGEEAVVGRLVQASLRAVWAEPAMKPPVEAWWGAL